MLLHAEGSPVRRKSVQCRWVGQNHFLQLEDSGCPRFGRLSRPFCDDQSVVGHHFSCNRLMQSKWSVLLMASRRYSLSVNCPIENDAKRRYIDWPMPISAIVGKGRDAISEQS